jgi:hypothetical protein
VIAVHGGLLSCDAVRLSSALKMEAVYLSETLVPTYGVTTRKINVDIFTAVRTSY